MPEVNGQRGQIGGRVREHDFLYRRFGARDFDDIWFVAQPPQQLGQQRGRLAAEGACDPRAACGHVADELLTLGADGAEQHGFGVAFELCRHISEIGRRMHGFEVLAQAFDEAAKPEALELRHRCLRLRFFHKAHRCRTHRRCAARSIIEQSAAPSIKPPA